MDTSSTFSDQDTCTDGGICERIAALSAASGVSRLEVTPNREDSQIHLTSFDEDVKPEPKMVSEKGVAFSVEFQEASKPLPPPRLMSRIRTKELEKTITGRENVNNEGVEAVNDRKDGAFKNKKVDLINDNHRGVVTNRGNEAFGVVQSRELGATKNKSLAFELSFNNEPRSKSSKDKERVLLRSPFKTSKMWANKNQKQLKSNANPTQSLHAEALDGVKNVICTESVSLKENNLTNGLYCDLNGGSAEKETSDENVFENIVYSPHAIHAEDGMDDEHASKILERNSFTLDSTSQEPIGASDRNTCEVVRNNESSFDLTLSGQQLSSNSVEQKQQKRNTFTLDSVLRFVDDASEKGKIPQKVSNEAPDEKYWEASKTSEQPIKHLEKGSTFILESVNQEKFQIAAVGEKSTLNKPFSVPAQTEGKCTLQSLSRSAQDTSPCQVEVTNVLDDLAHKEESNQRNANSGREGSDEASPKKRSTFTLETISHEIDSAIEKYFPSEIPRDEAGSDYHLESTEKRSTYTLDSVSHALQSGIEKGLPACQVLSQFAQQEDPSSMRVSTSEKKITKRGTFTLDDVSQSLEEGQSKGLPVDEVLAQLSNQEKEETLSACGNVEFPPKRGTFPLDSASQNLEEAEEKGIPTVEALCQLASEDKCQFDDGVSTEAVGRQRSSQKRETYTLDEVSNAIEEAIEKGIAVCLTLDHLAQEVRGNDITTSGKCARDLRETDSHAQYSGQHDEYEASFEDALEKLEDCVSLGNEEAFSTSSFQPRNRGTYDLNEVSTSLLSGAKAGVPVVETLDHLSRKGNDTEKSRTCEQNRRTYTLGEVSRSLEAASEQGIPVIEALRDLTKDMSSTKTETSEHKRGTYTLDEVSNSLEHAKQTGIPVIEALESLAKEKRKSPLRLKIPDRGTYTLDEVSVTLEKAQQRGLPVVDALGHLTMHKDIPIRQSPDAVHRRQEKLVNRKTYALASPLETIGEGTKLRLYDGNQRQMMSPLSFHIKPKDSTATETKVSENKAGIVQKLDFLTTACELLLKANAKEMAREHDQSRNTETEATRLSNVDANCDQSQTDRNTYPLENVALTIKDAKEKGIPVLDSLDHVASAAEFGTNQNRTNATLLNSESDVEQITNESKQDRLTHSLENVSRTLEDAHKAGIPVIQTLDQLANELAEFSLTTMSASPWIPSLREDNTKRKRYSETAIGELQKSSSLATRLGSPYPPPIRKAYSLEDVANAVKHAFKSGTSLTDILDSIEFEKPVEPVSSSTDVRPRSVDSGFISSFSDNDISLQSVGSPYNRSKNHVFDGSNDDLVVTNIVSSELRATGLSAEANSRQDNVNQNENRRTFTFDHVTDLSRGLPVIESLGKLCNNTEENTENKNLSVQCTIPLSSKPRRKVSPPKPKRHIPKKPKSLESKTDSFFIEFYNSETLQWPIKDETSDDESKIDFNDITTSFVNESQTNDNDLVPAKDPNFVGPKSEAPTLVSSSTPYRGRATWRPSGSVLDQIASLMDAAEDCGISPADVLNQVNMPCESSGGEIEESQDETEEDPAVTSQLALLRMQLKEKRRQIEEEKRRTQVECEDQHRRLRQTAFWYVMGKTQRSEECSSLPSNQVAAMQPHSQDKPRNQLAEFPDQASPPIAWSSPANSPLPSSVTQPSSDDQQFETREFRLSDHPPVDIEKIRPSSQPTVERNSRPTPVPPRPSSHDPAASHNAASTRKCWNVESGTKVTPTPLARRDMAVVNVDTNDEAFTLEGGTKEENEAGSASKKGLAMFIGDNLETQGLTPDQEKKREKFLRMRQKKQEEDRTRKEAELEKKRKREERQREKEILKKTEQERIRQEELVRERAEQELRMKEAQAARVPDSFGTYRRAGPWQPAYDTSDDANIYLEPSHQQPSGFADFSGPQCYVKPSGKSNRKIIVNAISYVCLSGTVNQEQKEKCLQAISECDGHHFMILFKDGLKFRGIYIHNLDNDQLYKVFGIGPRVVTSKMIEFLYKYNSGGKEFTKIPSKTISLSVDGFAMQKSCWNTGKPVVASKTSSNFKRPPRPSQR